MFDAVTDCLMGKDVFTCSPELAINHLKGVEMVFRTIETEQIPPEKIIQTPDDILIVQDLAKKFLLSFRDFTIPQI